MSNNQSATQTSTQTSKDAVAKPGLANPADIDLLEWARSDFGLNAFRALKSSRGRCVVWLEVVGLKHSPDQSANQLIGRLGDLGFQPGEPISVLGHAPLGEPYFVEIRETVLALRSEEAAYILVRTQAPGGI